MSERAHTTVDRATADPARRPRTIGSSPLAALQRTAGNRAVQRLVSGLSEDVDGAAISQRIDAAEGDGSTLDASVRHDLSEALGADPGEVRVHADSEADALSQSLGAKAFTSGRDIFFRRGTFDPSTPEGFELLLHESTHVLQQAEGPVAGTPTSDGALAISDPADAFEQAASSTARAQAPPVAQPGDGRSVQRWPDVDDLLGIAEKGGQPPGPLPGMLDSFGNAIGDDAASGNLGMGTLTKAAKAEEARESAEGKNIRASQKEFDSDVDAAAKWMGDGAGTRFAGGAIKEAWGIGSGIDSIVQNPLGFQKAQGEKASKEALPMVTGQYVETLGKVSRGEEGLGGAASELFGAYSKGKDNELAAQQAAAKPITDDVKSGNYAGAFGRLGTQVGVAILGMGEEGPLGEVGAEASAAEEGGAAVKQAGTTEGGLVPGQTAGELAPGATGPKTLPGVAPDPNPLPDLGPATVPEGPSTLPGVAPDPNPLPDLGPSTVPDPPTLPGLGPDLGPLTTPDPLTLPGLGPDLGPSTVPGLGPDLGPLTTPDPLTLPGVGEPPGPITRPGVAPDPNPLPELAPDTSPPGTLESPTELQGERVPEQSPLATSVRDPPVGEPSPSPDPGADGPATKRSAGNEAPAQEQTAPESEGNGPKTADGDQLANAQEEFEKAWATFSKEPFGYGLLPGWKP